MYCDSKDLSEAGKNFISCSLRVRLGSIVRGLRFLRCRCFSQNVYRGFTCWLYEWANPSSGVSIIKRFL